MLAPDLRLPIGQSDFRQLRESGLHYVDKSLFIQDVLDSTAGVLLIPRPRRFGNHREQVVILEDEYDPPINAAFSAGYYDEAMTFFRGFFSGALKDNPHLFKGVLTGILRVAKESIFSGLNNLAVYSLLRPEFSCAELRDAGARPIHEVGAVFDGKRAWVRMRRVG